MKKFRVTLFGIVLPMLILYTVLFVKVINQKNPTTYVEAKESSSYELEELDSMYNDDFFYWVDPETGVNYIVFYGMDGRYAMTPRLSSNGKIMVTHN